MRIFFITGTSGSGKSTIMELLKVQLPSSHFSVHDFDEIGVPPEADQAWRTATTRHWTTKAQQYSAQNKTAVICGVTVPSEVIQALKNSNIQPFFAFLKIDDVTIKQRLQARGWSERLIQDNINWAQFLESEVKATKHHLIIESTNALKPQDVVSQLVTWLGFYT